MLLTGMSRAIDVTTGAIATSSFTNQRASGSIRVEKVDENGESLAGACFLIGGIEICDNGDGDTNADAGVVEITGCSNWTGRHQRIGRTRRLCTVRTRRNR